MKIEENINVKEKYMKKIKQMSNTPYLWVMHSIHSSV